MFRVRGRVDGYDTNSSGLATIGSAKRVQTTIHDFAFYVDLETWIEQWIPGKRRRFRFKDNPSVQGQGRWVIVQETFRIHQVQPSQRILKTG